MASRNESVETSLSEEDKTTIKNSVDLESPPVKRTTDSSCSPRKKLEGRATVNEQETSKNNLPKKRIGNKNKKKLNLNNKEPAVTNKKEQKVQKNGNKSLDEYENWHLSSTTIEKQDKENQDANSNKKKVFSPNHKLTEYFSDLRVRESSDSNVDDDDDLKKAQINQHDKKEISTLNSKEPRSGTPSQSARRKQKQPKPRLSIESTNRKVTDYFHVRRSERKYKKNILDEKQKDLENKILREVEDGLKVTDIEGKGRGVTTTRDFCKGDFVVEYIGDLIDGATAKIRESKYAKNKNIGCYMYYFKFKDTQYCIDATKESGKLGRLINHSRKGNLVSKVIEINEAPHLVLLAKMDIAAGVELLYDYGDRNKESVKHHPWLIL